MRWGLPREVLSEGLVVPQAPVLSEGLVRQRVRPVQYCRSLAEEFSSVHPVGGCHHRFQRLVPPVLG